MSFLSELETKVKAEIEKAETAVEAKVAAVKALFHKSLTEFAADAMSEFETVKAEIEAEYASAEPAVVSAVEDAVTKLEQAIEEVIASHLS